MPSTTAAQRSLVCRAVRGDSMLTCCRLCGHSAQLQRVCRSYAWRKQSDSWMWAVHEPASLSHASVVPTIKSCGCTEWWPVICLCLYFAQRKHSLQKCVCHSFCPSIHCIGQPDHCVRGSRVREEEPMERVRSHDHRSQPSHWGSTAAVPRLLRGPTGPKTKKKKVKLHACSFLRILGLDPRTLGLLTAGAHFVMRPTLYRLSYTRL